MNMKDRHVVVVSVDAMVYEDLEILSKLYTLEPIWEQTARVDHVKSVYPTITYPCHSTMMTGVYPDKHGIVNNESKVLCVPSSPWQCMRECLKGKTIFDYTKEQGLTTAAVFWPVTGNDPNIDYLVDEYWPHHGESTEQCFRESGSSEEVIEKIVKPNMKLVENRHRQHPFCDAFIMACACDMLTEFKPNLLMVHPANVDAARHSSGLFTSKVESALHETNMWLSQLMKAADDAGILDKTDFFIVSDHGQIEVRRCIAFNALFAQKGLIELDEQGNIVDWKAFAKSGGLSALIYLKNPDSKEDYELTRQVLEELKQAEVYGIGQIFTEKEVRTQHHLGGDFAFCIESDGYTTYANNWTAPVVMPLDNRNYRFGRATHGYLPEKGPQPTLIALGPHIKQGVVLKNANLVDEAPTFAKILGIDMKDTDGRPLEELLNL